VPATLAVAFAPACSSTEGPEAANEGDSGAQSLDSGDPRAPILDGSRLVAPPPTDGAAACPVGICNYQTGQGCSGGAPSCVPLPSGSSSSISPACSPAGSALPGSACTQWSDCVPGSVCAEGQCRKLCCGTDSTACPSHERCIRDFKLSLGDAGVVASGAELCYPVDTCSVLELGSCDAVGPRTACQVVDPTGATACSPEGVRGAGDQCGEGAGCMRGFTCVHHFCRRFCRAELGGGEPSCPVDEGRCVHFPDDPSGVGECTPI